MQDKNYITEDEIDLRELFKTIWNNKKFIFVLTFLVTLCSVIYVSFKNPIPIYQGKTYIEIGQIQSQNFGQISLDAASDIVGILKVVYKVDANILNTSTKIVEIVSTSEDKSIIKQNLENAVESIINKHKEKAKFYENVIMTKQISDIEINENPINKPKKALIVVVAFITGFVLSIFIVFFIQFINNLKKEDKQ